MVCTYKFRSTIFFRWSYHELVLQAQANRHRPSLCYKCRLCKRFCALTLVEASVRVVLLFFCFCFFTVALWFIQYRINLCWRGNSYDLWFVHTSLGRQACPTRDRSRVWYRINLCKQATRRNCSKNIDNSLLLISGEVLNIAKCPKR